MNNTEFPYEPENLINAVKVTTVTLVGYMGDFPRERGNCFSIETENGSGMRVLNFGHENLEELLKREIVQWPIAVLPISERHCLIADHRIPDEWYSDRFCSTCTPFSLLPPQQKLERVIDLTSGKRTESKIEIDGQIITTVSYKVESGHIKVPFKWSVGPIELRSSPEADEELSELMTRYKNTTINPDLYGTINLPDDTDKNDKK